MASQYEYYNDLCECPGTKSSGAGSDGSGPYEYFKDYCVCPGSDVDLGMRDLEGNETTSYPVTAYNVNEEAIGVAANRNEYITLWNSDAANLVLGTLKKGNGPFGFRIDLNPGQTAPPWVIGETIEEVIELGIYGIEYGIEYE